MSNSEWQRMVDSIGVLPGPDFTGAESIEKQVEESWQAMWLIEWVNKALDAWQHLNAV